FAELLGRAGHEIVDDPSGAELVLITTPDDRIADVCDELAERGVFRSGRVAAHASGATSLGALASARRAGADVLSLHPLQTSADNVERVGPEAALTGPAARGDAGTIRANVEAIERAVPDTAELYVRLARATLELAARAGRLDPDRRRVVEDILSRWR